MGLQIGETVYVKGCVFNTGTHYVKEYKLRAIEADHIKLELISTIFKDGKVSASGEIEIHPEPAKTLAWLARPIKERLKEHSESVRFFCESWDEDE